MNLLKLINSNFELTFYIYEMINLIKIKMFKKFLLTSFLILSSLITIYPSKKENTNFLDYCYSLEKIISRNSGE